MRAMPKSGITAREIWWPLYSLKWPLVGFIFTVSKHNEIAHNLAEMAALWAISTAAHGRYAIRDEAEDSERAAIAADRRDRQ